MSAPEPLVGGAGDPANLLLRDVRALDPRAGLDARRDVSVRDGRIAELAEPGSLEAADGQETIDGRGRLSRSPPSSTRTCTCAPPARSTRRTSRPAPARPPPAATQG